MTVWIANTDVSKVNTRRPSCSDSIRNELTDAVLTQPSSTQGRGHTVLWHGANGPLMTLKPDIAGWRLQKRSETCPSSGDTSVQTVRTVSLLSGKQEGTSELQRFKIYLNSSQLQNVWLLVTSVYTAEQSDLPLPDILFLQELRPIKEIRW